MSEIAKPINRGPLRQFFGMEYYILRRKINWWFDGNKYASKKNCCDPKFSVFKHQSMILRPLQGIDMQLQENKRTNLKLALEHLNSVQIQPGEIFSIWKLVGRPTKRKGYLDGLVLKQGQTAQDTGGGLCQLGNLLFWIIAHSPLTITERHRHGFDVFPDVNRKVPFGAGATLSFNHIDFQFKNTTDQTFQINLWLDDTHLNGELLAENELESTYSVEERNHVFKQQLWGRYSRHNEIFQIEEKISGEITEQLIVENHAIMMYSPFIETKEN